MNLSSIAAVLKGAYKFVDQAYLTANPPAADIAGSINAATAKTTPVDADLVGIVDSAASNVLKKVTRGNIKATLKAYLDTLYAPIGASGGMTNLGESSIVGLATNSFTGIGSSAEIIHVSLLAVSVDTSSAVPILVQLGDAGGLENTTYDSSITYLNSAGISNANRTDGVPLDTNAGPAGTYTGDITIKKISGNKWEYSGILRDGSNVFRLVAGVKTVSGTVDRVGIVAAAGLFDGASAWSVSFQ